MVSGEAKFKVAICGAGIGGLMTAVALSRFPDIDVEIFEGAVELAEVGAGIGLFSRPWEIIRKLGLEEELLKLTDVTLTDDPIEAFKYRKSDRPEGIEFYTLVTKGNLMAFHRPDFQKVLLGKLPKSYRIYCSKRLRSYTQQFGGPISLLFEDGSKATCDVLLGADGIKSAVRRSLMGEKAQWAQSEGNWSEAAAFSALIEPEWSGVNAYRALIPADRLRALHPHHRVFTQPTQYLGKNGYIIAYSIAHGKFINFVAFKSEPELEGGKFNGIWVCPTESAEFANLFKAWEPEAQALIECVERPLRWAIHTVKGLKSFVSGNAAVLGDAAHAMPPHEGAGAGQAMEDAYIISQLLGHPLTTKNTIARALSIFDQVRRPIAHHIWDGSRLNGQYFTFEAPGTDFDGVPEHELPAKLNDMGHMFTKNWEWCWTTSMMGAAQEAVRLLESSA